MSEPVKWVSLMANCTIRKVFDIIFEQTRLDVRERNNLELPGSEFDIVDDRKEKTPGFKVQKRLSDGPKFPIASVFFTCNEEDDYIRIDQPNGDEITVTREWDDVSVKCVLSIGDDAVEPWQISKRSLSKLFFS